MIEPNGHNTLRDVEPDHHAGRDEPHQTERPPTGPEGVVSDPDQYLDGPPSGAEPQPGRDGPSGQPGEDRRRP